MAIFKTLQDVSIYKGWNNIFWLLSEIGTNDQHCGKFVYKLYSEFSWLLKKSLKILTESVFQK